MKINKLFSVVLMAFALLFTSCEDDEPSVPSVTTTSSSKQKITKPSFDKFLSTSDKASFSILVRFKTGGDKEHNLSATVHWKAFASKPSKTPSKGDLTNVESMRQYGSATYHNTGAKKGMTESIVFEKSHAGYSGGYYIYYFVECSNSKGSATSSITYMVTPR